MRLPTWAKFIYDYLFDAMKPDQEGYGQTCPVCLFPFSSPVETVCRHLFCSVCAQRWFEGHNRCPTCRRRLFVEISYRIIASDPIFERGDDDDEEEEELGFDYR
ncbi:hypothetical protein CERZMDRAFT_97103 [Cercospora zeae-maydis SCOH1-5]|uniref:RING-type domain-containing protein n=1 Tax=Cercospora zeae-maydis SCOH1-5 TaxID=717836 RepID=A0A6A6FGS1_9PEZI|nr:hypothetical protein CERZMDRAFT_97103 [Cercospora zeae-maydis SCOH1-5]